LDPNVYRSARNIDKVTVSPVSDLNALAVLKPRKLLVTRAALDAIKDRAHAATSGRADNAVTNGRADKAATSGRAAGKAASRGRGEST
jgi:large subunit ribosomal protein L4